MADQNEVIFHILEYFNSIKNEANGDGIDTITSLIESEFNVLRDAATFQKQSVYPVTLAELVQSGKTALNVKPYETAVQEAKANPKFDSFVDAVVARGYFEGTTEGSVEYFERYAKLMNKFAQKTGNTTTAASSSSTPSSSGATTSNLSKEEAEKQAEELKLKGNAAINAKDYPAAIAAYTEALNLSPEGPNSHVYFSNRAAAYCHMNKYQEAVDDCLSSVTLSPDYVKAYSRLGLSYFFLEKYQEAVDAYERAAEIEPDNKATQDSLRQARNKLKKVKAKEAEGQVAGGAGAGAGLGGMPNMAGLMGNPAMKKALDQVGGPAGLSNLMKDPQMMAMAQQMMKDPQMMQQAMSMLGGGGGGAGGMPDFSALAGMMGGMGGAPPSSSSSAPSSSSAKGGKKAFKGFEE